MPLSLDSTRISPFLRTLAPFRGIDGVFGSVFVCVCLLGWVFRFLLECLAGCLYPFFLDIAGSSDPATENQNQKLIRRLHSYECNGVRALVSRASC